MEDHKLEKLLNINFLKLEIFVESKYITKYKFFNNNNKEIFSVRHRKLYDELMISLNSNDEFFKKIIEKIYKIYRLIYIKFKSLIVYYHNYDKIHNYKFDILYHFKNRFITWSDIKLFYILN